MCLMTLTGEETPPRGLRSCADLADEIVVLDSGSQDATGKIAAHFQARWQHQDWLGYVGQKNKLLTLASHEWVFSIDPDEELSPALPEEIHSPKQRLPRGDLSGSHPRAPGGRRRVLGPGFLPGAKGGPRPAFFAGGVSQKYIFFRGLNASRFQCGHSLPGAGTENDFQTPRSLIYTR